MSDEQKISMKDFRMWLQGVEEMQPEDWVPDARQWARIREKIDSVDDGPVSVSPTSKPQSYPAYANHQPTPPAVPSGPSMMPPAPRASASPQTLNGPFANGSIPVRTPDVDTSGGKYESSFA